MYSDDIICFDIETTSCWLTNDGRIVPDCNLYSEKWYNKQTPIGFCYEWTLSINGTAFYGRNLEEAVTIFKKINKDGIKRCVFVHNLAFEFVFLTGLMTPEQVFARQPRHPMKVVFYDCDNLEFRCTYMLTRLSLAEWGIQIGKTQKQIGYGYSLIRTPNTPMSDKELKYCEDDVLVMHDGLLEELKEYVHIHNIPLTQTGKVRRKIKSLLSDTGHLKHMASLVPDYHTLQLLYKAYIGGYAHGNYIYVGSVVTDVGSWDFKSSYPYVMTTQRFPMTPWKRVNKIYDTDKYAYLIHVKLYDVKSKTYNTFLSASKCVAKSNIIRDNGRIRSADMIELVVTELDWDIINKSYEFDREKKEYIEIYESKKGYLPREFILYVLQLYGKKTSLKGIEGHEAEYRVAKELINALYGMLCTAIIFDDMYFDVETGKYKIIPTTRDVVEATLDKMRNEISRKNFTSFSWGVWVTAHARHNLWSCILRCDLYNIYDDTDSLKCKKGAEKLFVDWYNNHVMECIKKSAKVNNIPIKMFMPKDKKGNTHIIGTFDHDGEYTEFVTQGAKRYCYRDKKDGELHMTVSGIPKPAVIALDNDITKFKDDFVFDRTLKRKDFKKCVGSILYYINNQPKITINKGKQDEYTITNKRGIAVRRKSYTLGYSPDFLNFLLQYRKDKKGMYEVERICEFEKNQ